MELHLVLLSFLFATCFSLPTNDVTNDLATIERRFGNTFSDCIEERRPPRRCPSFTFSNTYYGFREEFRTIDGTCNNIFRRTFGATETRLKRIIAGGKALYFDRPGLDTPAGFPTLPNFNDIPTPQEVSNKLFQSVQIDGNMGQQSLLFMVFGQFMDHDMSITEYDEERFSPSCTSSTLRNDFEYPRFPIFNSRDRTQGCRRFSRAFPLCQNPFRRGQRELPNSITSFIDASNVYGSSREQREAVVDRRNPHLLKVTPGRQPGFDLLPRVPGNCVGGQCFIAGDVRSNEHIGLTAMHTLLVREHNRIAKQLRKINFRWSDEKIFEVTRKIVGGILQKIFFEEYAPRIVQLSPYKGYNEYCDPSIIDGFSTAAFRFGHTLVKNAWPRLDNNFNPIGPDVPLRETFFNNTVLLENGIEPFFRGFIGNKTENIDGAFAEGILKFLFVGPEIQNLFENLAARNIHRGRDQGIRNYNAWRVFSGLKNTTKFEELYEIPVKKRAILKSLYKSVEDIDLFAGGIIERPSQPGDLILGHTFTTIIKKQIENLRDGDRFYFKHRGSRKFQPVFKSAELQEINKASMARLLCDNLDGIVSIQKDPFVAFKAGEPRLSCDSFNLPKINLDAWRESSYSYNYYNYY